MNKDMNNEEILVEESTLEAKKVKGDFLILWEVMGLIRTSKVYLRNKNYPYTYILDKDENKIKVLVSDFSEKLERLKNNFEADNSTIGRYELRNVKKVFVNLDYLSRYVIRNGSTYVLSSSVQSSPERTAQVRCYEVFGTKDNMYMHQLTDVLPAICKWQRRLSATDLELALKLKSECWEFSDRIDVEWRIRDKNRDIEQKKEYLVRNWHQFVNTDYPKIQKKTASLESDKKLYQMNLKRLVKVQKYLDDVGADSREINNQIYQFEWLCPEYTLKRLVKDTESRVRTMNEYASTCKLLCLDSYQEKIGQYMPDNYSTLVGLMAQFAFKDE